MSLNTALEKALKDSEWLIDIDKKNDDQQQYRDQYLNAYEKFGLSYRELLIYRTLGECLSQNNQKLNILDVGSGQLKTAQALIESTSFVATYTAIDMEVYSDKVKPYVQDFEYHKIDILADPPFATDRKYDIVLIDIEPHGREIDVYEKIKQCLADTHLCILKHVGYIDLYGSGLADKFLTKYEESVADYYGETLGMGICPLLSAVRDVFIIYDSTKTTNIRNFLGRESDFYYIDDDGIKKFCRCSKYYCQAA